MRKLYIFILSITSISVVSMVVFIVYLHTSGQIQFIPDRFAEEFWKFLANLSTIAFGFILINVFWARKEQKDKISQGRGILLNYLLRINRIGIRINELLALTYSESEFDKSQVRDGEIIALIHKIQRLSGSLENLTFDPLILGDENIKKVFIELVWEDLLPSIDTLSNQDNFRKNFELFRKTISDITTYTDESVKYLIGSKKVER